MKRITQIGFVLSMMGFAVQLVHSDGNPDTGRLKAETCLGCHASPTAQNIYPTYRIPKVGGQHAEYIVAALKDYRAGVRPHLTMQANAWSLSDQDIEDIAAFFAASK